MRLLRDAPAPRPADPAAAGTIPTRAFRYCEPVRLASAIGWYVFAPVDLDLSFDGAATWWTDPNGEDWRKLDALKDRDFARAYDAAVPEDMRGTAPVTIGTSVEPGVLQVWSGLVAQCPDAYSLLVRNPPNLPVLEHFQNFEGVIEADRWLGPLFTNIRITKTDRRVSLRRRWPLFFAQLVRKEDARRSLYGAFDVEEGMEALGEEGRARLLETMSGARTSGRELGRYARQARKRAGREARGDEAEDARPDDPGAAH